MPISSYYGMQTNNFIYLWCGLYKCILIWDHMSILIIIKLLPQKSDFNLILHSILHQKFAFIGYIIKCPYLSCDMTSSTPLKCTRTLFIYYNRWINTLIVTGNQIKRPSKSDYRFVSGQLFSAVYFVSALHLILNLLQHFVHKKFSNMSADQIG